MNSANLKNTTKKEKIIWAVDPTQNPVDAKSLLIEMKSWAKHLNCSIQPVSVFSTRVLGVPGRFNLSWKDKLEDAAQNSLDRYLKKTNMNDILPAEKLFIPSLTTRQMALELAKYAEKNKALLIFAHTRAKKTWNPFRLGGFVEILVSISRTPVLLLNPDAQPSTQVPSILYPTNFSRNSEIAFSKLIPWVKAFDSNVLLFSQVEAPPLYMLASGYSTALSTKFEHSIKQIEKFRQKKAQEWVSMLPKQKINAQILIQRQRKSLARDILDAAKKNDVNLIALEGQKGIVGQALLGSVAQDILLQAKCPVLIFHRPKATRKSFRSPATRTLKTYESKNESLVTHRV